jgi:acyl-CoA synthetase (NDP forming)
MTKFATLLFAVSISFSAVSLASNDLKIFKNQDAIQSVLKNASVLNKIGALNTRPERASISVVSTGSTFDKIFVVRIASSFNTPVGLRSCYNDIKLSTELTGSKTQIKNQLIVESISPEVCKTPVLRTASI